MGKEFEGLGRDRQREIIEGIGAEWPAGNPVNDGFGDGDHQTGEIHDGYGDGTPYTPDERQLNLVMNQAADIGDIDTADQAAAQLARLRAERQATE